MSELNNREKEGVVINPPAPGEKMDKKTAKDFIGSELGQMAVLGANSSEYSDVAKILEKLEKGEIQPEEAVEAAIKIKDNKQDYR